MKTNELKQLIRTMVRECVHEMLAERYIEHSINEMAGTKQRLQENIEVPEYEPPRKKKKPVNSRRAG